MAKQMIYIRLKDGYSIRRPVEAFKGLLFKDDKCEVLMTDGARGFVSRNMARKVLKARPEILKKKNLNALLDWLASGTKGER